MYMGKSLPLSHWVFCILNVALYQDQAWEWEFPGVPWNSWEFWGIPVPVLGCGNSTSLLSNNVTRNRSNGSKDRAITLVTVTLLLKCSQRQRTAGMRASLKCFEHDGSLRYLGKCELWHANHHLLKHSWFFFIFFFTKRRSCSYFLSTRGSNMPGTAVGWLPTLANKYKNN